MDAFNNKVNIIKKFYKKEESCIELSLINYAGYNIYITLNYNKKYDYYKLRWFDLDKMNDSNVEKYDSCSFISNQTVNIVRDIFGTNTKSSKYIEEIDDNRDIVVFKTKFGTKVDDEINVKFKRFIPNKIDHIMDLFFILFNNMPKNFEVFFYELASSVNNHDYNEEFNFDLFKGDLNKLFSYPIIERGENYYIDSNVKFLEKIDGKYYAVVEGNTKYAVVIDYDEKNKNMSVSCSCPCEFCCKHIYAVILSIRNNKFNKFFKIMYSNSDESLLDKITNFNFALCIGIEDKKFIIVSSYGKLESVDMFDEIGKYCWEIIEDNKTGDLKSQIKEVLDSVEF